jgi:hypothetical protein
MPEITPIVKEGTITLQANTQQPSVQFNQALHRQQEATQQPASPTTQQNQEAPPQQTQTGSEVGEHKAKPDQDNEKVIKARLFQEKMKRQIESERRKIQDEKRQLEVEKSQSRKWFEAEDLVRQGKVLEAAQRAGISYEQMTQQILNNGQIPPAQVAEKTAEAIVERKMEEWKKHTEAQAKASQAKAYQDSLRQIESEIRYTVDRSDKYTLAKASEPYKDITRLIESEFHRTGRVMPVEEAIERWETETLEGLQELWKLEKVRSRVQQESHYEPPRREQSGPNTISQRAMAPVPQPKPMNESERKQRAIDAFYGRIT